MLCLRNSSATTRAIKRVIPTPDQIELEIYGVGRKNPVRRLWRSQVADKTLLLRWMLGRRGWECYVPRLGVHDGAAGAVWVASGRRCAQCEQLVAPVPGVENLTAISNFWALTARSLIGKSGNSLILLDFGPACHAGRRNQPRTRLRCFRTTTVCSRGSEFGEFLKRGMR